MELRITMECYEDMASGRRKYVKEREINEGVLHLRIDAIRFSKNTVKFICGGVVLAYYDLGTEVFFDFGDQLTLDLQKEILMPLTFKGE